MSVFHQILVAHDGSTDSDAALDLAVALARDQHATLTLLTVVPDLSAAATSAAGAYDLDRVYGEINRRARDGVPTDVAVRTVLRHGAPARAITELAAGHDLVVMGTHGRGRIGEALAGSVSRAVVHALRGPVLLMRAPADAAPEPTVAGEIGR